MNKIEHELKWSIESNYIDSFFFNGEDECIRELDVDNAVKKCFESVERHAIGFADFIETNEQYLHYWKSKYTTEQLFKLYIEQL